MLAHKYKLVAETKWTYTDTYAENKWMHLKNGRIFCLFILSSSSPLTSNSHLIVIMRHIYKKIFACRAVVTLRDVFYVWIQLSFIKKGQIKIPENTDSQYRSNNLDKLLRYFLLCIWLRICLEISISRLSLK